MCSEAILWINHNVSLFCIRKSGYNIAILLSIYSRFCYRFHSEAWSWSTQPWESIYEQEKSSRILTWNPSQWIYLPPHHWLFRLKYFSPIYSLFSLVFYLFNFRKNKAKEATHGMIFTHSSEVFFVPFILFLIFFIVWPICSANGKITIEGFHLTLQLSYIL